VVIEDIVADGHIHEKRLALFPSQSMMWPDVFGIRETRNVFVCDYRRPFHPRSVFPSRACCYRRWLLGDKLHLTPEV